MIFNQSAKYIFLLLISFFVIPISYGESNEQRIKVDLRLIGHEFLLALNDSTSRVLPIENVNGRYAVKFEREFRFEPNLLLVSTLKVMEASRIMDTYIIEVENCETKELVYSVRASIEKQQDMQSCLQREVPVDCYVFYFTVIENVEPPKVIQNNDVEVEEESSLNIWMLILGSIVGLILILIPIFYFVKRKKVAQYNSDLINIGQFQYDQKGMMLLLKAQSIELSSKESDLLYLLFTNENKTVKREDILRLVWGDEGDYVGRTLDVFISKLRKKLEADSSLKIVNIRGIGYRFVIN